MLSFSYYFAFFLLSVFFFPSCFLGFLFLYCIWFLFFLVFFSRFLSFKTPCLFIVVLPFWSLNMFNINLYLMINILLMWLIHILGPGRNAWFMFGVMIDLWTTNRLPIHGINSPLNVNISAESWYLEISTELLTSSLIDAKTLGFCSLNHPMTLLLME